MFGSLYTVSAFSPYFGDWFNCLLQEFPIQRIPTNTAQKIDHEISEIIERQYLRAIDILKTSKGKLTLLAERLLEKEVIFKDDLENILGVRPFKSNFEKIEEAKALKLK